VPDLLKLATLDTSPLRHPRFSAAYDLRNETDAPVQLHFAGVIPKGQRPTIPTRAPSVSC
jgi:hypothetical protein